MSHSSGRVISVRSPAAWIIASFALISSTGAAAPIVFRDEALGFSFDLHAVAEPVCVLRPLPLRQEEGCRTFDVPAIERSLKGSQPVYALIQGADWMGVAGLGHDPREGNLSSTKAAAEKIVGGLAAQIGRKAGPTETTRGPVEFGTVSGTQSVRTTFRIPSAAGPQHVAATFVFARRSLWTLMISGPAANAADVDRMAAAYAATIHVSPSERVGTEWPDDATAQVAKAASNLFVDMLWVVGLVVVVVIGLRARRR